MSIPAFLRLFCGFHFLLCFSHVASPFAAALTNSQDANALIALHKAWSSNPVWDTSTDPCHDQWLGVNCDETNTSVIELTLINQRLDGILPAAIGNLTNLTTLDLSSNPNLGGNLPMQSIVNLSHLTKFYVQFCNFSGAIPSEIGGLTNLQYLGLTGNSFTGSLPASIGLLSEIVWLDVSDNFLNGNLPVSTSSGTGIGLDNLTNAIHFHLQNNSFSGSIPSPIFNKQMQLKHLLLYSNSFTGSIPSAIGDLLHVEIVRFDFNNLTGSIPSTIGSIQNLTTLRLDNNALIGQLPDLSNNSQLQILELGNNQFDASSIPTWITNLLNLQLLSLQSANLTGNISSELFALPRISNVTLGSNDLNGTLNLTTASPTLLLVNVTNNAISVLDRGTYAQELLLEGNTYCENSSTDCAGLQSASSPALPLVALTVSTCTYGCPDEYEINSRVSGNCQCARPVVGNVIFEATVDPLLTNYNVSLLERQVLTNLQNQILNNLAILESQVVVDILSSFLLSISVFPPSGTDLWHPNDAALIAYALKNMSAFGTDIGPWNCASSGKPYISQVIIDYKLSTAAKIGIGVGAAAFAVVIVVIGAYAVNQKRRAEKAEKQNKPFAAWIATSKGNNPKIPQLKGARWFSLDEIRKCTNNFSQNNEIGEGGFGKVYKGYLLSGERVAIKRAGTDSLQGATEFKMEIELLSRVHHKNLVGLIGFCFEEGEQMLVYEYMPNGTLRECLSGRSGIRMDWERRIAFALGSARGLAYLHNEANPPIIHRDIKSSNILMDDKLVPKIADFGLSILATNNHTTEIKGSLGYLDPDYFMTNRLTEKSDVYSFGVILLELITGRQPIQGGKYVVPEVRMALAAGGMSSLLQSFVDPDLIYYPPKAMEKLVELSLRCVEDEAAPRPSMGGVVKELEPLAQEFSMAVDIDMGPEARSKLYAEGSPDPRSSFEYSGSYINGMSVR